METINEIIQSLFFITVGVIAILTYIKARHTLLQPIRTEVFKEQVRVFSKVLNIFSGKEEFELQRHFGLEEVFQVNMVAMYDAYASLFFDVKFDKEKRPYSDENCPGGIYSKEAWEICEGHLKSDKKDPPAGDVKAKEEKWGNYIHDTIYLPKRYVNSRSELKKIITETPLLPSKSNLLLEEFIKTTEESALFIGKFIVKCAAEMPEKYPDLETFKNGVPYWMENHYREEEISLKPKAEKIISFIREYYDPDSIGKLLQ